MTENIEALIASLRSVEAPESLFPLAATASALMTTAHRPGALLIIHLALLIIAQRVDDSPLTQPDWDAIRIVLSQLADLLESQNANQLDPLGMAWRAWSQPESLQ